MPTFSLYILAMVAVAGFAATEPQTVTDITPEQASAIESAGSSLIASLTADPAFTSVILELASDTSAFNALTELVGQPTPTGTEGLARVSSLIAVMPPGAQSLFRSFTSAEQSIESSILNAGVASGTTEGVPPPPASIDTSMSVENGPTSVPTTEEETKSAGFPTIGTLPGDASASTDVVPTQSADSSGMHVVDTLGLSRGMGAVLAILAAGFAAL